METAQSRSRYSRNPVVIFWEQRTQYYEYHLDLVINSHVLNQFLFSVRQASY